MSQTYKTYKPRSKDIASPQPEHKVISKLSNQIVFVKKRHVFNENTIRTISTFNILDLRNSYNNGLRLNKGFLQGPILYYFDIKSIKKVSKIKLFSQK